MRKLAECGKRLVVISVVALLCAGFLGCVKAQQENENTVAIESKNAKTLVNQGFYGGTLKVALPSVPTLNPTTATGDADWTVLSRIYESLGVVSSTVPKVDPWLAESWTVTGAAGTQIQVTLKSNIKWHDSTPFTGDDVKFTFETGMKSNPKFSKVLGYVSTVTVSGNTLTITVTEPYAPFINEAMLVPIIPKLRWQSGPDTTLTGSGPFKFKQQTGNVVELEAYTDYFKGRPYIDGIKFVTYLGANATLEAVKDLNDPLDPLDLVGWGVEPYHTPPAGSSQTKNMDLGFYFMGFNLREQKMTDPILMKSIAYCVDKNSILSRNIKGNKDVMGSSVICPANILWFTTVENYYTTLDKDNDGKVSDQEKLGGLGPVRDMLLNAGYLDMNADGYLELPGSTQSNVKWLNISVLSPSPGLDPVESAQVIDPIVSNMRWVGLNAVADVYTNISQKQQKVAGRDFDIYFDTYKPSSVDPGFMYDLFDSVNEASTNTAGYSNSTFDDLIENANKEKDFNTRNTSIAQAQRTVAHDLPYDVLYYTTIIEAVNFTHFEGWVNMTGGIKNPFSFLSIHKPLLSKTPLSVDLKTSIKAAPERDVKVNVTVKNQGSLVDGAKVLLTASEGSFTQSNGTTSSYGYFTTTFHTPSATEPKTVTITATAVKFQYTDGLATADITISPGYEPQLQVSITGENEINSKEASEKNEATFEVTVTEKIDSTSIPVKDATVTVTANLGGGEFIAEESLKTDDSGKAVFKFKASATVETRFKVTATAEKPGYLKGSASKDIIVIPLPTTVVGPNMPAIGGISVVIVIALLIILYGLMLRMKEKKKAPPPPKELEKAKKEEGVKEAPPPPKETKEDAKATEPSPPPPPPPQPPAPGKK